MTRYSSTMTEALQEIREGFSPKQIKMAIGIASDKRYAGGNMTGAVQAIEKIKKGLADHPQVAAVLKRQNEDIEEELDEMKMDDPKLNKIFDKLKKGQTIKLKTSSTISQGKDFVEYIVKSKNTVNKGRVEKVTLVTKGNEKAVKKFLYKRDGKVTFAIGDMGASIDDIKEAAHELAEKLKVSDGVGAWIKDFQKSDAPQFQGKSEEDRKKMALAAFADAGGKLEETELNEKKFDVKTEFKGKITVTPFSKLDDAKRYLEFMRKKGHKGIISQGGKTVKEELDEAKLNIKKIHKAVDDGKSMDVIVGMFADKRTTNTDEIRKIVKDYMFKKRMRKEEDEKKPDKPDSAKAVDQSRDDKKKTRIAQLQLQIAKATETINKLNTQEKPNA